MQKNSYNYNELISCGEGKLFGEGNAKLPLPPMLMFDRITEIKKDSGEVIWGSEAFIDEVFKALYGNEYEYEIWSYNDALQKIKNLVQQVENN